MSLTDDVRSARRERQFHSARDFETSASQIGEVDDPGEDLKRAVRAVIAGNAKGRSTRAQVADAALLMQMLGVYPGQDFDPTDSPLIPRPSHMRDRH